MSVAIPNTNPQPVLIALAWLLREVPQTDFVAMLQGELAKRPEYPLTDWQSGAVGRTHIEIDAQALSDLSLYIQRIAGALFIATSSDEWLDLAAESQYALRREPAVFTEGRITVTCAVDAGPYRLPAPWWMQTLDGLLYRCDVPLEITPGVTQHVAVRAEHPGPAYNVPDHTITELLTPLPGLSVVNAEGWMVRAGADRETDARLRERCTYAWPELGSGATYEAYVKWALDADPSVHQVRVLDQNPRGPGTIDVVIWGEGGIGESVVDRVAAYIEERRPLTSNVLTYAATQHDVPVVATCYCVAAALSLAQTQVAENMATLQRELPIGGVVYRAALYEAIMRPVGMINVVIEEPDADIALGEVEAAVFEPDLTWVAVASANDPITGEP